MPADRETSVDITTEHLKFDLLVLGAGMAGLTAAAFAAKNGFRVIVVEKGREIGGNGIISSGYLWTAATMDVFRERCPEGDQSLGRVLVEGFAAAVDWVRSTGAGVSEQSDVHFGIGHLIDVHTYLHRCVAIVESNGGSVQRSKEVDQLLVKSGRVIGARLRDEGGTADVHSDATIFATGGFQANRHLMAKHYGENARQLLLRSNFASDGDALRLATEVGAATAGNLASFYGHLIAWPLDRFAPGDFFRFAVQYSDRGVLVNLDGERFTDESLMDHISAQEAARQRNARALLLIDDAVREEAGQPIAKGIEGIDIVAEAKLAGAHVASAGSLAGIADQVTNWGFNGAVAVQSFKDYNRQVVSDPDSLDPGRRWRRNALTHSPFHGIEVRPGVTFTEGGLRVDDRAAVLGPHGPIEGLYAAGADVGGIFNGGYAGGLALATVFGLTAAASAVGLNQPVNRPPAAAVPGQGAPRA